MTKRSVVGDTLVVSDDLGETLFSMKETFVLPAAKIFVSGRITQEAIQDFEDELMSLATVCNRVILDFEGARFISNGAFGSLVELQKQLDDKRGSSLVLRGIANAPGIQMVKGLLTIES